MKLLLCHCVGEKFFTTFDFLNNKPSQIDSNVGRRDDFKNKAVSFTKDGSFS